MGMSERTVTAERRGRETVALPVTKRWKVEHVGAWDLEATLNRLTQEGYTIWQTSLLPPDQTYPGGPASMYVLVIATCAPHVPERL